MCPLIISPKEQDQSLLHWETLNKSDINSVSCSKAETGTKVNNYRLLEVYGVWPFTSLGTTQTVNLLLYQILGSVGTVVLVHGATVYYRNFEETATRMSKDLKFVISLSTCFVFQDVALRLTLPLFYSRLNQNRLAGLRRCSARAHFNNGKLNERIYKWGRGYKMQKHEHERALPQREQHSWWTASKLMFNL